MLSRSPTSHTCGNHPHAQSGAAQAFGCAPAAAVASSEQGALASAAPSAARGGWKITEGRLGKGSPAAATLTIPVTWTVDWGGRRGCAGTMIGPAPAASCESPASSTLSTTLALPSLAATAGGTPPMPTRCAPPHGPLAGDWGRGTPPSRRPRAATPATHP